MDKLKPSPYATNSHLQVLYEQMQDNGSITFKKWSNASLFVAYACREHNMALEVSYCGDEWEVRIDYQ